MQYPYTGSSHLSVNDFAAVRNEKGAAERNTR
jgi:hypothetical protein